MLNNDKHKTISIIAMFTLFFIFPYAFYLYLRYGPMRIPRIVNDTKIAYIYHPKTDRLYKVELAATLSRSGRGSLGQRLFKLYPVWRKDKVHRGTYGDIPPWIPIEYFLVANSEYLGSFRDIYVERSKELSLMEEHPRQYIDQKAQEADKFFEEFDGKIENIFEMVSECLKGEFDYFELSYYRRVDINTFELIPDSLAFLKEFYGLFSGDAIIVKWKMDGGVQTKDIEILKEVLIIRGDAAEDLRLFLDWESDSGYYYAHASTKTRKKGRFLHWRRAKNDLLH